MKVRKTIKIIKNAFLIILRLALFLMDAQLIPIFFRRFLEIHSIINSRRGFHHQPLWASYETLALNDSPGSLFTQ